MKIIIILCISILLIGCATTQTEVIKTPCKLKQNCPVIMINNENQTGGSVVGYRT